LKPLVVDRADARRKDEAFLNSLIANDETQVLLVWRSKNHVDGARPPEPVISTMASLRSLPHAPPIFLGDVDGCPRFAVDISEVEDPAAAGIEHSFADLRRAGAFMEASRAKLLGYARAMCRWNRVTRHCELCAGELRMSHAGFARDCISCSHKHFPRTDVAVMILVTEGDECLLARQASWPKGMYSALAGFVEPGESLEDCVHRETGEEVGLSLSTVVYRGSHPWPFPRQLMVGYECKATSRDVSLDDEELSEFRWCSREEARDALARKADFFVPPPLSLAHGLIKAFAAGE
jgi:NAD+ diphosphatase